MVEKVENKAEKVVESLDPLEGISTKTAQNFISENGLTWVHGHTNGSVGAMASDDTDEAKWISEINDIWSKWIAGVSVDTRWSSIAECWNEFSEFKDGYIVSKVDCVCVLPDEKFSSSLEKRRVISTVCNCNDSGILRATIYLRKEKEKEAS